MRTSMDVTPGYDENGKEFLTMSQKWAIVFYWLLMPCVGSRREIILKLHYKKLSNIYTTSQEGYILLELKNNWGKWTHLARKSSIRLTILMKKEKKVSFQLYIQIQGFTQVWMIGRRKA